MYYITIENLEIFAHHGVLKEENVLGQKFILSFKLYLDISNAGREDDLEATVNYASLCEKLEQWMQERSQLIETVAYRLCEHILLEFPLVKKVWIQVKKPWAPILKHVEYVSVTTQKKWNQVYLSIGSNLGDKKAYLDQCIKELQEDKKIRVEKVSDYIETEPVGEVVQDNFLNGAVSLMTLYEPQELLEVIHEIEAHAKRERKIHWGPRTLDIDILLYENQVIHTENLMIPHPEMTNRMFVLEPLAAIAPYAVNPITQKTILNLKEELEKVSL